MQGELLIALRKTFSKDKELLRKPDKFIEEVRDSFQGNFPAHKELEEALNEKLIYESLFIIDRANPLDYKLRLVDNIYLLSFQRVLEKSLKMDTQTAIFSVIPLLFGIIGLDVDPVREDNKIAITIEALDIAKNSGSSAKGEKADKSKRNEYHVKTASEEYHHASKPYRVSDIITKWIVVAVFLAFCGVIIYGILFPPKTLLGVIYDLVAIGLAGAANFFFKVTQSIVPMFDKYVEKEADLYIEIICRANDIDHSKTRKEEKT
jgi:hypothetical protein